MTTASKITLARVVMIPIFMVLLLLKVWHNIPALIVFIIASCTDFVDGYIARHHNQVSDFGKFLDPLADKLLVISAMLIYIQWGWMAAWAVMIVLTREFAVTGLRLVAVEGGRVIAAAMSGKVKTFTTMVGLCIMMVFGKYLWLDWAITIIIVIVTLVSGIEYFVKNWDVLNLGKQQG